MTIPQDKLPPFAKLQSDGRIGLYLDASMCSDFNTCEKFFYYQHVASRRMKGDVNGAREIGTWWSKLMQQIFDAATEGRKFKTEEVMNLAGELWVKLGYDSVEKENPKVFKSFGGLAGALRMALHYASMQLPVDYASWHIVAVESIFGKAGDIIVGETDGFVLYWIGKPDLVVIYSGRLSPVDHKTKDTISSDTINTWKPNIQLPGYLFALQQICRAQGRKEIIDRVIINCAARRAPAKEKDNNNHPRFQRFPIIYAPTEIEEWRKERMAQARRILDCASHEYWAMTGAPYTCHNHFNRPCDFRRVCSRPSAVRDTILNSDYIQVDRWTPWRDNDDDEKK